jgi:hypothetical protein
VNCVRPEFEPKPDLAATSYLISHVTRLSLKRLDSNFSALRLFFEKFGGGQNERLHSKAPAKIILS